MQLTYPSIDEAECLRTLQDIVRIKSYSQTQGEIDVTNHVASAMKEMGVDGEQADRSNGRSLSRLRTLYTRRFPRRIHEANAFFLNQRSTLCLVLLPLIFTD